MNKLNSICVIRPEYVGPPTPLVLASRVVSLIELDENEAAEPLLQLLDLAQGGAA